MLLSIKATVHHLKSLEVGVSHTYNTTAVADSFLPRTTVGVLEENPDGPVACSQNRSTLARLEHHQTNSINRAMVAADVGALGVKRLNRTRHGPKNTLLFAI